MRKLAFVPILFLFIVNSVQVKAQEFFVNADLVSSFIWRGLKFGDACFQPSMGVNLGKFSFMAWGSTNLNTFGQDVDLFLTYADKGVTVQVADYFCVPGGEKFDYFNYGAPSTNHIFEANISYQFSEKLPFILKWSTLFGGSDYNKADGSRAYSSYLELAYPFSAKGFDFRAEFGITPWEGMYAEDFNVVNISLSMSKKIKITDSFSVPVSCKFVANPSDEQTHIVFAVSF